MIADDIHDIRDAMRRHAQAKVQAEAEAAKRAEADVKPADLPTPKPLFSESAPPFRGFLVSANGTVTSFEITPARARELGTPPGGTTTLRLDAYGGVTIIHESYPDGRDFVPEPVLDTATRSRGFFVTEDGDIRPFHMPDEQAAIFGTPPGGTTTVKASMGGYSVSNERAPKATEDWANWIDTQEGNVAPLETTDPFQFTRRNWLVHPKGTAFSEHIDEQAAAHVQAASRASNRYTFWGCAGEDPDGQ